MADATRKDQASIVAAASVCCTAAAGLAIGRFFFQRLAIEKQALIAAKENAENKSRQLAALYNVFTEITENLSLNQVVQAALRETNQLMHADGAVIWLVKNHELHPAGGITRDRKNISGLEVHPLGDGLMDRAVKRGRTIRIDDSNQSLLSDLQRSQGLKSGVLVPLIIGGKVLGLLNCWSIRPNAFTDENQRVLEMMSSQVAAALTAAETTEVSQMRAQQDPLTGLPNRRQLTEDIARDASLGHIGQPHAVVAMVDVDNFKRINDEHGHRVGDLVLQAIAAVLQRSVRANDALYRYGGEEFLLVFNSASLAQAQVLAERVRNNIEQFALQPDGTALPPVTISIGLAAKPTHAADLEPLIDLADRAMYDAKTQGRNRVVSWNVDMTNSGSKLAHAAGE